MPRKPFSNPQAFAYWAALGEGRALETVAAHFRLSVGRIEREANEKRWQERLAAVEGKPDQSGALLQQLADMDERVLGQLAFT